MCLYVCVVRCYCKASKVLQQYQHMPSFHGIQQDCQLIVQQLRARLKQQFHVRNVRSTVLVNIRSPTMSSHLSLFGLHTLLHLWLKNFNFFSFAFREL